MAADPNLDLGLDYTGGITKPTPDQIGYVAIVDESGFNLKYITVAAFAALLGVGLAPALNNATGQLVNDTGVDLVVG